MNPVTIVSAGLSHQGKVREENQDQFLIGELNRSLNVLDNGLDLPGQSRLTGEALSSLFLVADGMGGHLGGREASTLAIHYFVSAILNKLNWYEKIEPVNEETFLETLRNTLFGAHRQLQAYATTNKELKDMGTTLTFAYVAWPKLFVVHAGDTRCYLYRDNELRLLTRDHTVAHQMMLNGQLNPQDQERSPWSNVLMNALGAGAPEVFADIYKQELKHADRLLLCSDGLNKHASDSVIAKVLAKNASPRESVEELIQIALNDGGSDNITVVVADMILDRDFGRRASPSEDRRFCRRESENG
jgi:PPM family protein phosphatase